MVRSAPDALALVLKRNLKLGDDVLPASEESARSTQPGMVLTDVDKPANGHVSVRTAADARSAPSALSCTRRAANAAPSAGTTNANSRADRPDIDRECS